MGGKRSIKESVSEWRATLQRSTRYKDAWLFLLFIIIAAIFWFVMVLNESVEETYNVRLNIYNKPDSVTFISDPPSQISVTVRDKGTQLIRGGFSSSRVVDINFREYSSGGALRCSNKEFYRLLRGAFGSSAQILSSSSDSLRLAYTTLPGKRVPVDIDADLSASLGNIVSGSPTSSARYVLVYSDNPDVLDTIYRIRTQRIVRKNLKETTRIEVRLAELKGVKIVPSSVTITVPVEALVNKSALVPIVPVNVPSGMSVLLFPSSVDASFYIPLGKFNADNSGINIVADFSGVNGKGGSRVPLRVASYPDYVSNVVLKTDSVEFTLVKSN